MTITKTAITWYRISEALRVRGAGGVDFALKILGAQNGRPANEQVSIEFSEAQLLVLAEMALKMLEI